MFKEPFQRLSVWEGEAMSCNRCFVGLLGLLLVFGAVWPGQAAEFQGLGDLPGGSFDSLAFGVSGDGLVVVGMSMTDLDWEAFRWTQAGGMVGLGDLPGGAFGGYAMDASRDGSVVVGAALSASGGEAFRWTQIGGMIGLGDLPGGSFYSHAPAVSADGLVVVGSSQSASGSEAYRWTEAGGMIGLGDLPGGNFFSTAYGVSADGSVLAGTSRSASGDEAFRWTQAGGMVGLGDLPGGSFRSNATDISADGSVVVGAGQSASGEEAFLWSQAVGMIGLGDLPGGSFYSHAQAVSADGLVVVGWSRSASGYEAFIWDPVNGMRSVKDVLESEYGIDLTGWMLESATGISDDGNTIVGVAYNPSGQREAWMVTGLVEGVTEIEVVIDIKPGSDPNSINLGSNGVLPVAILTTEDFVALDVADDTVLFGDPVLTDPESGMGVPVLPVRSAVEDVDGDGDEDLQLFFSVPELTDFGAMDADSTEALLLGETSDGVPVFGLDSARIVPPKGKGKSGK